MTDTEELGLPGLPRPKVTYADHSYPAYSERQMIDYAQAARSTPPDQGATWMGDAITNPCATPADHSVPVAWMRTYRQFSDHPIDPDPGYLVTSFHQNADHAAKFPAENVPLYAAPQPEAQSVRDAQRVPRVETQDYFVRLVERYGMAMWESRNDEAVRLKIELCTRYGDMARHAALKSAPPQKPVSDEVKP